MVHIHNYATILFNAEVLVWFDAGCSCSYSVNEQSESGSLQVCAQILFIPNGTEFTNYTVTISADNASASAQSKLSKLMKQSVFI